MPPFTDRPVGEWICLQARTELGGNGCGIAESALYDETGLIGRATQSLAVPLIGPGGPFDFMGGRVADSKAYGFFALGTRPGFPREIRAVLLGESLGDANFASGFEGPSLDRWYVYNQ